MRPSIEQIEKESRDELLIDLIKEENEELSRDAKVFGGTNQRTNYAITAREKRENWDELKKIVREKKFSFSRYIDIAVIFAQRFFIQIANLLFAFLIGYIYRLPSSRTNSTAGSELTIEDLELNHINPLNSTDDPDCNENLKKDPNLTNRLNSTVDSISQQLKLLKKPVKPLNSTVDSIQRKEGENGLKSLKSLNSTVDFDQKNRNDVKPVNIMDNGNSTEKEKVGEFGTGRLNSTDRSESSKEEKR
ncbi:MAG: hypothetical protein JSU85_08665, partial [Candidatus Zixiibacteriota bacterium]